MKVPVLPLLQCTDTEIFYPVQKEPETYENDMYLLEIPGGLPDDV